MIAVRTVSFIALTFICVGAIKVSEFGEVSADEGLLSESEFALQIGNKMDANRKIFKIDKVGEHGVAFKFLQPDETRIVAKMDGTTLAVYCNEKHVFSSPMSLLKGYQVSVFSEGSVEIHRKEKAFRKLPPDLKRGDSSPPSRQDDTLFPK